MTLDSVHFEAIDGIVDSLESPGRATRRTELAERLWETVIVESPDDVPIEPLEPPARRSTRVDDLAVATRPFDQVAAVDAGSLNPTTFQNGLVVDLAHAAMATTPSDVDRHRRRTILAVVHGPPAEVRSDREWSTFDDGFGRVRMVASPPTDRDEETAVHTLALEGAEIEHAHANRATMDEALILDGSVYPASILHWQDREGALRSRMDATAPRNVLQRSIDVVDDCVDADVALFSIVKNWTARGLVRQLEDHDGVDSTPLPWRTDYGLFQQWLNDLAVDEEPALRWTSWFRMDYGVGRAMPSAVADLGLDTAAASAAYGLGFMVVYDPRENVAFRVEAPLEVVTDPTHREAITTHVLSGVAQTGGPPPTLDKADQLAGISRGERQELYRHLERVLGSRRLQRYDAVRWPEGTATSSDVVPVGNR